MRKPPRLQFALSAQLTLCSPGRTGVLEKLSPAHSRDISEYTLLGCWHYRGGMAIPLLVLAVFTFSLGGSLGNIKI